MKWLGIDPGKFGTKAVTKDENGDWVYFYLRSKIQKTTDSFAPGDSYLVDFEEQHLLVGEAANHYSLDTDKQNLQHRICTYIAVEQLAGEDLSKIVIGCPFSLFKNPIKREAYESYLKGSHLIDFKLNNQFALINIEELISFPECGGIAYSEDCEDFKDNVRGVIDIGGLNVNACIFENLAPISESIFTVNQGSIILKNRIRDELNKIFYLNLQEHDIGIILKKGLSIDGVRQERADKVISDVISEHFEVIIREAKKHNWSISTMDITLGGGGALDLKGSFPKYIPQAKMSDDPVWGNAKGNYYVARMYL